MCKHQNTAAASAISRASVWCPDCKQWVVKCGHEDNRCGRCGATPKRCTCLKPADNE